MLTKLDRLKGYSARETCVALLSMLAILLFASAIAVAQTPIVVSQQIWGANETNSTPLRAHGSHGRRTGARPLPAAIPQPSIPTASSLSA